MQFSAVLFKRFILHCFFICFSLSHSLSLSLSLTPPLPILPYYTRCSDIDIVSGVALFDTKTKINEMVSFANTVAIPEGGIGELVFNASVGTINIANYNTSEFNANINQESRASLDLMGTSAWRKDAYDFCAYPCVGIAFIESYGSSYDRSINGDSYQIERGSCNDSTTISDAAWYFYAIISSSAYLFACHFVCLSVCLSVCDDVFIYEYSILLALFHLFVLLYFTDILYFFLFVCSPVCLFARLSVCLPACLPVFLIILVLPFYFFQKFR